MKENAFVTEVEGKYAKVTVKRKSACSGCHKEGGCFDTCQSTSTAVALNLVNAKKGDLVVVETHSKIVLLFALLMYILPIFLSLALMVFSYVKTENELVSAVVFIAFLVLYYLILNPIIKKTNINKNVLKVIEIL